MKEELEKLYRETKDMHIRNECAQLLQALMCPEILTLDMMDELRERFTALLHGLKHEKRLDSNDIK